MIRLALNIFLAMMLALVSISPCLAYDFHFPLDPGNNTRSFGMGGAFVAVADVDSAPCDNPAALAKHQGFILRLPGLTIDTESPELFLNIFPGDFPLDLRINGTVSVIAGRFELSCNALGMLYKDSQGGGLYNDEDHEVQFYGMISPAWGGEITDKLSLGSRMKFMFGIMNYSNQEYNWDTDYCSTIQAQVGALGLASDVGVLYDLNRFICLGAVVKNVGIILWDYKETTQSGMLESDDTYSEKGIRSLPTYLEFGAACRTDNGRLLLSGEIDTPLYYGPSIYRLGAEYSLRSLRLRSGLIVKDGNLSLACGFGIYSERLKLDIATHNLYAQYYGIPIPGPVMGLSVSAGFEF